MIQFFTVLLVLSSVIFAQESSSFLSYPSSVIWNTPFEVSIVTSTNFPKADKLEIFVESPERIELKNVTLNTFYGSSQISFIDEGLHYKTVVDLKKHSLSEDIKYQLILNFKPDNTAKAGIKISGVYTRKDHILGSLFDGEEKNMTAVIDFYKPKKYAGKAMLLKDGSAEFKVKKLSSSIISDFWFKTEEKDFSILKMSDENKILAEIYINLFGMLSVQSSSPCTGINPYFISSNTWNHLSLALIPDKNSFEVYCNGDLVSSNQVNNYSKPGYLKFLFGGEDSKEFVIDQLKFSETGRDGFYSILENRSFISPPEGIPVLQFFRFDDESLAANSGIIEVNYNDIKFIRSDAPVGLKSPDLNINILTSSIELEWSGGDYRHSEHYILERSENNREFESIYTVLADNNPDAVYRYVDRILNNPDILYYRVKQVLKDGSEIYSSQVKVGRGFSEPFTMGQNFPNPFNPRTSIDIELFRDSEIKIMVFNLEGKEVGHIYEGRMSKGKHKFLFDAGELPSGVYICRVTTPDFTQSTKMILTK